MPTYGAVKKNDPQDLISREQATYNVLGRGVGAKRPNARFSDSDGGVDVSAV
jgi:hypothetical protein